MTDKPSNKSSIIPSSLETFFNWIKRNSKKKINPSVLSRFVNNISPNLVGKETYISYINEFIPNKDSEVYTYDLYRRMVLGETIILVAFPGDGDDGAPAEPQYYHLKPNMQFNFPKSLTADGSFYGTETKLVTNPYINVKN